MTRRTTWIAASGLVVIAGAIWFLCRPMRTGNTGSPGKDRWVIPRIVAGDDHIEMNSTVNDVIRKDMVRLTVPYSSVQRFEGKRQGPFVDSCLVLLYPDSDELLATAEFVYDASSAAGEKAFFSMIDSLRSIYHRPFTWAEERVTATYSSYSTRESFTDSGSIAVNIEVHRDEPVRSSMTVIFSNLTRPAY